MGVGGSGYGSDKIFSLCGMPAQNQLELSTFYLGEIEGLSLV